MPSSVIWQPARDPSSRRASLLMRLAPVAVGAILAFTVAVTVSASTISLSAPTQAGPGSTIMVTGRGLPSDQAGKVTYDGAAITKFSASSSGWFSVPFTIPSYTPLGHVGRISAKTNSDDLLATTTLTIGTSGAQAAISVPGQAGPGSTITVSGTGFAGGLPGYLTFNGMSITTFVAGQDGSFNVPFTIPNTARLGVDRITARTEPESWIATTTLSVSTAPVPADPGPTDAPAATDTPAPVDTVAPTDTPAPIDTPLATAAPTAGPTAGPSPTDAPTAAPSPTVPPVDSLPDFSHVYVIVMENHEYSSVVGSSSAPFVNSLIARYGLATNYYGVGHPSEPNYIGLTSGSTQGITDDGVYNLKVNNIFDQVEASGRTWHAYMQSYPGNCYTGSSSGAVVDSVGISGTYVRKHDPAISYTSISGNAARCASITNFSGFDPAAANFEFITPNLMNDMHDGSIADGDNFLKAFLPRITSSAAFSNSVVFLTFDEGSTNTGGGGHVVTIAITPNMTAGFKAGATSNHYSMLRTIEQAWGLPYLGNAASAAALAFPY